MRVVRRACPAFLASVTVCFETGSKNAEGPETSWFTGPCGIVCTSEDRLGAGCPTIEFRLELENTGAGKAPCRGWGAVRQDARIAPELGAEARDSQGILAILLARRHGSSFPCFEVLLVLVSEVN